MTRDQIDLGECPLAAEADRILTAYGRWARDRPTYHRCGSAEGRYRSTDVHVGVSAPVILIADWSAARVQRALLGVPELERRLLTAWYTEGRGHWRRVRLARRDLGARTAEGLQVVMVGALRSFLGEYRKRFD